MNWEDYLGKRLGDFTNSAYSWAGFTTGSYKGQCVTYVRGRAKEKLGVEFQSGAGSAKNIVDVALKRGYKVGKTAKADSFVVFSDGRYTGDKWGHVRYLEGISGDNYYYTEANSNNDGEVSADDGILKKASIKALLADSSFLGFVYMTSSSTSSGSTTTSSSSSSLPVNKITFKKGNYTLRANVNVRTGAGVNYSQKLKTDLTTDGQAHAVNQKYACLKSGTTVTVKEVKKISDDEVWAKIPSGWIALMYSGDIYVTFKRKVTATTLNVREKASTSSAIKTTKKSGDIVTITAQSGDFGKISEGWIHLGYTEDV
ncbi:MAG: SH3 domain-containing protein [Ruminococcus sp.]|nr:SH3 domain-containing protein [Ruminococcus sp.]